MAGEEEDVRLRYLLRQLENEQRRQRAVAARRLPTTNEQTTAENESLLIPTARLCRKAKQGIPSAVVLSPTGRTT